MKLIRRTFASILLVCVAVGLASAEPRKWEKGKGWGWVWGADDEVGSLNEMTSKSVLAALTIVKKGEVRDLGITYDRRSYKWPGHSPAEVMTYRSPAGVKSQKDLAFTFPDKGNTSETTWHSCALFMNDNVAT